MNQKTAKSLLKPLIKSMVCLGVCVSLSSAAIAGDDLSKVGASLNKKVDIDIADIPEAVLSVVMKAQPDFKVKEAEKELKHGKTYFDIEGEKADGSEVEFDLLLVDNVWKIMEEQRDVRFSECPNEVQLAYKTNSQMTPKRIIESKQSTGEVIYEFYSVDAKGKEAKSEIKFHQGKAEFLAKEWAH